tara:strand:- start:86598 stop:87500 length:903 start_codon:yes stop_codon:yes gene_type:complete
MTLFISFFSLAHAEEKKEKKDTIVRVKTKRKKPAILLNPKLDKIPLELLRFDTKRISREQIEQRLRSGGDDVGNGGDEIRRTVLEQIESIKKEAGPAYPIPDLSTKGLAVVSNLELASVQIPAANTPEGILINRELWKKLSGDNKDLRILLLNLLFVEDEQKEKALSIYSILDARKGKTPYCSLTPQSHKLIKVPRTKTFSGAESSQWLSSLALKECNKKGLNECRVLETGKKGFGKWAKNFATYQGFEYKVTKKSSQEIKSQVCDLAKACEQVYELAPMGQLTSKDFLILENKIERNCF